jgi:hypothetical protein
MRFPKKLVSPGQQRQNSQNMATRTGQLGQDNRNRKAMAGQLGQDNRYRIAEAGQSWDRAAGTEQLGQDS